MKLVDLLARWLVTNSANYIKKIYELRNEKSYMWQNITKYSYKLTVF